MLQPILSILGSGYPIFYWLRNRFLLTLSLLILLLVPASSSPRRTILPLSSRMQRAIERNRAAPQSPVEARTLEPDQPLEREFAGGQVHPYRLTLAAGQYARIVIDQKGINIALWVFDPDGNKIAESDLFFIGDVELFTLVAETPGTYRVEVRSSYDAAPKGRYQINIKELRDATPEDRSLVAAERLIAEGLLLESNLTVGSRQKAIEKYRQSIPFSQSAKAPDWEAMAVYLIANAYINLGEKQKAFDFANQGVPIAQTAARQTDEERRLLGIKVEAITLETLGRAHTEFGDRRKALELFNQALARKQAIQDRAGETITLNNMGMAYKYLGESPKALDLFNQARLIASELGDFGREGTLLNNLCVTQIALGEYKKAIDSCGQSIASRHKLRDQSGEAIALSNIGNAYSSLGEYQKALDFHDQALTIHKSLGNRANEAISLNNIGWVYSTLGEYQKAADFYNQARAIFRAAGDHYREANVLSNLAVDYAALKEYRKALDIHQQVLPLRHKGGDKAGEAITLNNMASCFSNLGDKQKALDYYDQALALHRSVGDPRQLATALKNIGDLHRELGEYQKALDRFQEGLQLSRAIGDQNNESKILAGVALLERDRGNAVEARKRIEEALVALESLRLNVKSYQLRASFLASMRSHYEFYIDILMRLHKQHPSEGFDAAALEASERGRARSLLELLSEARSEIRKGADPVLVERERTLRQTISDKAERQARMSGGSPNEEQTAISREIDALTTEYEQVQSRIRETSPQYAALTQPVPLGLKDLQKRVLDDETLLLEYTLGEEKSFLWAVTPTALKSFELPRRADIEQAARRVYELLATRNKSIAQETLEQRQQRVKEADKEYSIISATLSRMLIGPVATEMKNKRLLIVADGILQYVPFAALPNPAAADLRPLIVDNEMVSAPSASAIAVLRQFPADRLPSRQLLAVLADPVFSNDDPRVGSLNSRAAAVAETPAASDVKRSAVESGLPDLVRLRFSRQEANAITRFAAHDAKLEAVDFAANRNLATGSEVGRYCILHFATHGLINNEHPELSGIVLSLVDEQGRPQNGFLRLYDIYNLKLRADLVVLSACQTALGREVRGEGIIGLTRGFMYAGASRVAASLWRIDDRATAELMRRFYQAMLQESLSPAAALRAAQVSMWRERRWQPPYYWAAFTLQGEWR